MTKKSQQGLFRRFLTFKSNGGQLAEYVGLNCSMLREWIESKWTQGMSWDNYGKYWVVDHIVPLRMFDLTKEEDMKLCWNYKNCMPLLKSDNERKNGNVYLSYILLLQVKGDDYVYNKLFDIVSKEVHVMDKYVSSYFNECFND